MTYRPNLADPRVAKRIIHALDWCEQYMKKPKAQWLSQREIQRHFGSLSRPLGKWLRDSLLICVNPHYDSLNGLCKSYRLNTDTFNKISQDLGKTPEITITEHIESEIASGEFVYTEKSSREYHPLQNLPKRIKRPIFASRGYRHEYDICCSAQTLILQHARHLGFTTPTPFLDEMISDRDSVRRDIADRCQLPKATVKRILTAILNGASLSTWHENHIFQLVDYNRSMISQLKTDAYITGYRSEVRQMWRHIRKSLTLRRSQRLSSKMKSEIYRSLEESVRSVIKRSLRRTTNRAFIEHDGWTCERAIDICELTQEVKRATGFVIELEWTVNESVDS